MDIPHSPFPFDGCSTCPGNNATGMRSRIRAQQISAAVAAESLHAGNCAPVLIPFSIHPLKKRLSRRFPLLKDGLSVNGRNRFFYDFSIIFLFSVLTKMQFQSII
jgi:hypothetical protein